MSLLTDGLSCRIFLSRNELLSVMDTMFFIGINTGLLVLLAVGLLSAREQIKTGRKETI